jgi:hypothetical protein
MKTWWIWTTLLLTGLAGLRAARAADDEAAWKQYIEAGNEAVQAAEAATNSRDRRDSVERAAGQFQVAVRMGQDKSDWRPVVLAAEGYIRLIAVATGNDKDNYTDLANSALNTAASLAKSKGARDGLTATIRVYRRLAGISAGSKLKVIEDRIQALERDAESMPAEKTQER